MIFALKNILYFVGCFMFFSIPIAGVTIFDHAHRWISPYTRGTSEALGSHIDQALEDTKDLGSQLFDNIKPNPALIKRAQERSQDLGQQELDDKVNSILSAHKRKRQQQKNSEPVEEMDDYPTTDRESLKKLLQ